MTTTDAVHDVKLSIARLATKGQQAFQRTTLDGPRPWTDADRELNHLAHGAAYHGFALVAVLGYIENTHGADAAQEAASIVRSMGLDGDYGDWMTGDIRDALTREQDKAEKAPQT